MTHAAREDGTPHSVVKGVHVGAAHSTVGDSNVNVVLSPLLWLERGVDEPSLGAFGIESQPPLEGIGGRHGWFLDGRMVGVQ